MAIIIIIINCKNFAWWASLTEVCALRVLLVWLCSYIWWKLYWNDVKNKFIESGTEILPETEISLPSQNGERGQTVEAYGRVPQKWKRGPRSFGMGGAMADTCRKHARLPHGLSCRIRYWSNVTIASAEVGPQKISPSDHVIQRHSRSSSWHGSAV